MALTPEDDDALLDFVNRVDDAILDHDDMGNHNLAGALLSRVVLLMQQDPALGKDLVRYVWEKLDEIDQANPGDLL